jgi:O-antigen ligase
MLGPIGVYTYVASFVFPIKWDFPMIILVISGMISAIAGSPNKTVGKPHKITLFLVLFLISMAISTAVSINWLKSFHHSVTFLPAMLIFFLIIEQFTSHRDIRLLYICFSITALGISIAAISIAAANGFNIGNASNVHSLAGSFSYIIVSRNDLTFLSLLVPFSFIIAYQKPFSILGFLAIISILLSLCTVVIFQSRGATLTFFITLSTIALFLEPRKSLWMIIIFLLLFLVTDALLGLPLLKRFYGIMIGSEEMTNGRSKLWWEVLRRFKDAPFLGHGPHTFGLYIRTPWPHNLYLEVLFGHGLVGFVIFMGLLFYGVKTALRLCNEAITEKRHFVMGALAALVGFCISALFELSFLRLWVTITLFMTLGIIVRLSTTEKKTKIKE